MDDQQRNFDHVSIFAGWVNFGLGLEVELSWLEAGEIPSAVPPGRVDEVKAFMAWWNE